MFRQEFRLGVLGGAERILPPWLKSPAKSKSFKTNKIAPEIAIACVAALRLRPDHDWTQDFLLFDVTKRLHCITTGYSICGNSR